jgi:hypothetical protein
MSFDSIVNRGEFFSNHYLDAVISGDLGDLRRLWDDAEGHHQETARTRLRGLSKAYFPARADAAESVGAARAQAATELNDVVLAGLGFTPGATNLELPHTTTDLLEVPAAATVSTGSGLHLVALHAHVADDVDDLFDTSDDAQVSLLDPPFRPGDKRYLHCAADGVSELFAVDEPPRWVMVVAGHVVLLAERSKWAEGRFLAVDLDPALERNDVKKAGELETIAALFSADALVPGDGPAVVDDLVEKSHKHAVGVSKELREGIRQSIEILATEVIEQRLELSRRRHETRFSGEQVDATDLTRQCLRYLYRLLVLLYAESRPELGIVPVNDDVYLGGYSLDRLRELVLVDLDTDDARRGTHLDESLRNLFRLVNDGNHAEVAVQALFASEHTDVSDSTEDYLQLPGVNALLFDPASTSLLDGVTLRNAALQQVLRLLMLSPEGKGKGKKAGRGFISYAQLGINQLGAVYEGLMAYTGFFAKEDLYEVAKGGDPSSGTWVVPIETADEFPDEVFVTRTDPLTGKEERVFHATGSFVFRLSGRDRQRSASYYTPEVLTRCVVKHALAELLGLDDYAPEHGSSGITEAQQILDLTICEPALGSGAFLNEAINQLSAVYLKRRQEELGETLDPERYQRELQKVKAHFALHQCYGVDLNATAVELAEVSLWLNCMHPGLKAPWFGLQLRRGNSLIGCRRATWPTSALKDKPWAMTAKDKLQSPVDRPLSRPLGDEIHHFLLPGHGWAAVADRAEAKEFRPERAKGLREWRATVLKAPSASDAARLRALAEAVEARWAAAATRIAIVQRGLRRSIDVWGREADVAAQPISRDLAVQALGNPDSDLGRLRTVMNAWVGLWFWELDSDVALPSWNQWLTVLEELLVLDAPHGTTGQLDMFTDLPTLLEADERKPGGATVAELRASYLWLSVANELGEREGAWHWELEFGPAFTRGGFDLQVGNPPWVRLDWRDDLVLAEIDSWWGTEESVAESVREARRTSVLDEPGAQGRYLEEVAVAEGITELLGSPVLRPVLAGVRDNLYMLFMDSVWRHGRLTGISGLLHPEGHFTDPKGASIRRSSFARLRRHFQHTNHRFMFEDVSDTQRGYFGINVYGAASKPEFVQVAMAHDPSTIDGSLTHDGTGELPGIQYEGGGWDLRPHARRVVIINEDVLSDWVRIFDDPGTPADEARLLRPVTQVDLAALSVLADHPTRLDDHDYFWAQGWNETNSKRDRFIEWDTRIPQSWDEVVLQGPHFGVANSFAKQPNEHCKGKDDYSDWDLEALGDRVIPRTNYQRSCDRNTFEAHLDHWNGSPATSFWRVAWRRMTQPGLERSLQAALIPPGPSHVHTVHTGAAESELETVRWAAFWSSIPFDYLVKVSGKSDVQDELVRRFPFPVMSPLDAPLTLRFLRLACLTADFADVWQIVAAGSWRTDTWTLAQALEQLGPSESSWGPWVPLRRELDRRLALVEIDALAALALGLSAEQLGAMFRTQFPVLRKYEYSMGFDVEGRKICKHHQSAGYRQSQLQERAKAGDLPAPWKSVWSLVEQETEEPGSVEWLGHYTPPFYRPDREAEMTAAYHEFQRRLDAGQYQ